MDKKIKSTVVGSYPKPDYIMGDVSGRDLLDSSGNVFSQLKEKMRETQFKRLVNKAINETIQDQEEAGIDIITDGEQRRDMYIHYILRQLKGFDFENMYKKPVKKIIGDKQQEAYIMDAPGVVAKIEYSGMILVDDFKYLQRKTKKAIKISIPGPTTMVDAVHNQLYGSDEELARDYAKAIREEVIALRDAGCNLIQFDDPGLLRNIERAKEWGVNLLDECFKDIDGITTIVHVCRSYPNKEFEKKGVIYKSDESYYPYLLDLLQDSKIDQISIEGKQGNLNPSILKHLGQKTVILGCIDVGSERIETIEEIVNQGKAALEFIEPEQLILGPDCGLLELSREVAKEKIANLGKAVEILNREYI